MNFARWNIDPKFVVVAAPSLAGREAQHLGRPIRLHRDRRTESLTVSQALLGDTARGALPSRERQRARGGRAADGPPACVVELGRIAGRGGRAQGLAPRVVIPDAAVAVGRSGADAPTLRVIEPSLRLGAGLIDREADDDRDENSKQRYIGLSHCPLF